jgi:hypothetical protein
MSQVFNGNKMKAKTDILIFAALTIVAIGTGLLVAYIGS